MGQGAPAELPPIRGDLRGAFGWRVNRLSSRATPLEIVGSAGGYLLSLFFLAGAVYALLSGTPNPAIVNRGVHRRIRVSRTHELEYRPLPLSRVAPPQLGGAEHRDAGDGH